MHESSVPTPSTRRLQRIIRKHVFNGDTLTWAIFRIVTTALIIFVAIATCLFVLITRLNSENAGEIFTGIALLVLFTCILSTGTRQAYRNYAAKKKQLPDYLDLSTASAQELRKQLSQCKKQLTEYDQKTTPLHKELEALEKSYNPTELRRQKQLLQKLLKAHEKASGLDLLCK